MINNEIEKLREEIRRVKKLNTKRYKDNEELRAEVRKIVLEKAELDKTNKILAEANRHLREVLEIVKNDKTNLDEMRIREIVRAEFIRHYERKKEEEGGN